MPDFRPAPASFLIYDGEGYSYTVLGWWTADQWEHIHPVVPNPDGEGATPWPTHHGTDPWTLT